MADVGPLSPPSPPPQSEQERRIWLCASADLAERGVAVPFDVVYLGQTCRAFAVRFEGRALAYLNRCTHIAMEMDYRENHFWDGQGRWLICATHGAFFDPLTGRCMGGPGRGGLTPIPLSEGDGQVHWHTAHNLQPVIFPT